MKRELLQDISDYISYLQSLSLQISFIDKYYHFLRQFPSLFAYNSHNLPYCEKIKSSGRMLQKCESRQRIVDAACKGGPFFGVCWAGVHEYVLPVLFGGEPVSYICVSGYGAPSEKIRRHIGVIARRYGAAQNELWQAYQKLSPVFPEQDTILKLVQPLCRMFELLYLQLHDKTESTSPPRHSITQDPGFFVSALYGRHFLARHRDRLPLFPFLYAAHI